MLGAQVSPMEKLRVRGFGSTVGDRGMICLAGTWTLLVAEAVGWGLSVLPVPSA